MADEPTTIEYTGVPLRIVGGDVTHIGAGLTTTRVFVVMLCGRRIARAVERSDGPVDCPRCIQRANGEP